MLNTAILIGRLTRDPETRTTQSGDAVCSFTLAVDRNYKAQDGTREADFLPVVCYRKLAELCSTYLSKGRLCYVVGNIRTRSYTAQDGTKRYVTEIIADEARALDRAPERDEAAESGPIPSFLLQPDSEEELPF